MKFQDAPAALLWSERHLAFHCPLAAGGKIKNFLSSCICSLIFIKNIPVSFDFITTWIQGVFLCSPCITSSNKLEKLLYLVGCFIWIVWRCTDLQTLNLNSLLFFHVTSYTINGITQQYTYSCCFKLKFFKSDFSVLLQRERSRRVTSIKFNIHCHISVLEIYMNFMDTDLGSCEVGLRFSLFRICTTVQPLTYLDHPN